MDFQVTARKWRPQKFSEVVGQEHITTTFINAFRNNRIAHAYIFAGPRGVGKTTTARILAKSLNCLNPTDGEPCNSCEMCESFLASQSMDIIEIDGASNRRIEEIRTLRESVKYAPTKGNYKVYIIDEVHMLTTESFNALLKTLEEPPEHTIFIFATTDIHKVPPTIISRCQRFDFRRIELPAIKTLLKKIAESDEINIDDQSLTLIAKKADGALRDAESLFDQVISFGGNKIEASELSMMLNLIDEDIYFKISDAMLQKKFSAAFEVTREIYEKGWNFLDFTNGLIEHFRNIMTVVIKKNSDLIDSAEIYKKNYLNYSESFSEGDLLRILSFLNTVLYELKSSPNERLKIEISLAHLIGIEKSGTITELLNNLKNLDTKKFGNIVNAQQVDTELEVAEKKKPDLEKTEKTSTSDKEPQQPKNLKFTDLPAQIDETYIKSKWKSFAEVVNREKFTIGSHLINSNLKSFNNKSLTLLLSSKEELDILTEETENKLFLEELAEKVFGVKYSFTFEVDSNSKKSNQQAEITNQKDTPLIKSIKNDLGGKELTT